MRVDPESRLLSEAPPLKDAGLKAHELRARVLAELHARPFAPAEGEQRILHFAFMADPAAAETARRAIEDLCGKYGEPLPNPDAKQHRLSLPTAELLWEHHGEFLTYSWTVPKVVGASPQPFTPPAEKLAQFMRLLPQPGPLLVLADLHILPKNAMAKDGYREFFEPGRRAASEILDGAAIVATDFHPGPSGFVRLLVLNRRLTPAEAGAVIRRLLEIETYRTLALLGLPEAEAAAPVIRRIESQLPLFIQRMQESEGLGASRALLAELTTLAAEIEATAAGNLFRFGATRAYHELVTLRLNALAETRLPDDPTLAAFLTRRLMPAVRTCGTIEARQDNLSQKLARAGQLLRTRVEIELESQNKDLLSTMNDRVRLQLKLQQAVKIVSIGAVTYYIIALLHLVFEGVHQQFGRFDPAIATELSVPLVVALVLWLLRRKPDGAEP
ncbi:MAG TPA: DUF3422 domain-containing protein [Methylocella sp.]|nr:DUF3422 domain-containing protein [Methylocella sp.]